MPCGDPPRLQLAALPTPLVRPKRLCAALDGADVWLKRDDLTGLEISGNKVRKLEYVLAAARAAECDTIVTEGTPQSNHCRATAAACTRVGLHTVLLFRPRPPAGAPQGNHLLDALCGAEVRSFERAEFDARRDEIVAGVLAELRAAGRTPRFTPAGASEPLGCWGYIRAAAELAEQLHRAGVRECDIITPLSSGGTYAGLLLGRLMHRLDHLAVHGVPVSDDAAFHRDALGRLCRSAIEEFALPVTYDEAQLSLIDGYVGEGYAVPYKRALEALRLVARTEGILLDPVYTAKAFCALLDGIHEGRFGRQRPVVFIMTGGIFSNFAWPELLAPSA